MTGGWRRHWRFVILVLSALVLASTSPGLADNAPMWESPAGLAPGGTTQVRMAAESVDVQVTEQGGNPIAVVKAGFDMTNDGPQEVTKVGFPQWSPSGTLTFDPTKMSNVLVSSGGTDYTPAQETVQTGSLAGQWYTWQMTFPTGTTHIDVSYQQQLGFGSYGKDNAFTEVGYVLRTGALWNGPIGSATIAFMASKGGFLGADPAAAEGSAQKLTWRFSNFKPTQDLTSIYVPAAPWGALQEAEGRASASSASAQDLLAGAQAVKGIVGSYPYDLLPAVLRLRYYPLADSWARKATQLDPSLVGAWEILGDLEAQRATEKHGWLTCWPGEGAAAYQRAAALGSSSATTKLAGLKQTRDQQMSQGILADTVQQQCQALAAPASAAAFGLSGSGTFQFRLGFKALADQIPDIVGQPLEDEHFNPENGDSLQHTTKGLMVWRKADNWTAFTNGFMTWINGPYGLQSRLNSQRFPWEAASP